MCKIWVALPCLICLWLTEAVMLHWRNNYISYSHVVSCSAGGRPAYYFVRVNRHETVTYDAKNGGIG